MLLLLVESLLGIDLIQVLDLQIEGSKLRFLSTDTDSLNDTRFSLNPLRCVKSFVHKVKLRPNIKPVQQKLRRLPFSVLEEVTKELLGLEADGIVERSDASEWISPIVVTKKQTDQIRLCVDLRETNNAIVPDCFPLLLIDYMLSKLKGAVMFLTLDFKSACHQVELHEDSRGLTEFIIHLGLFRFCRVPYGLCSVPSAFQKIISSILKGLPGVQCYPDDIIVYGKSPKEHESNLKSVLNCLQKVGLKSKHAKMSVAEE